MSTYHTSVLLKEAIDALQVRLGKKYVDATLGGGGYTEEILRLGGEVLGLDVDEEALEYVEKILSEKDIKILRTKKDKALNISVSQYPNITLVRGNFAHIGELAREHGFGKVAGIVFDFGVSGHQLEKGERGFSFIQEGPLDMRMDPRLEVTAKDLVNGLTKGELTELFEKLGQELRGKRIATAIVEQRRTKPIETTTELAMLVQHVYKIREKIHPATKVFQALRIAVNDELGSIRDSLPEAIELLEPGGRLVTITFHSLEDRIVKEMFGKYEDEGLGKNILKKPITPGYEEIQSNPRSRSAKMRIFEKI